MWLTLLQYLLYSGVLEPNLQYLSGMPVLEAAAKHFYLYLIEKNLVI